MQKEIGDVRRWAECGAGGWLRGPMPIKPASSQMSQRFWRLAYIKAWERKRLSGAHSIMTKPEKVLRYDLTADDGSGRHLIQYALPGRDFETAEELESDGLIKRKFSNGKWTTTKVFAPDNMRVVIWQFNVNEEDRVHGRPMHFPEVTRRWFYFDETTATAGSA